MGLIILLVTVIIIILVLIIGTKKEPADEQNNSVATFTLQEKKELNEGSIEDFEKRLDAKGDEVLEHATGYVPTGVKRDIKEGFQKQAHTAENAVISGRFDSRTAENNFRECYEDICEFHTRMGILGVIKRRHYGYKLVSKLMEDDRRVPPAFFLVPVKNPVDDYSTGFELWCNITFRKVKKKKFLEEAVRLETKAEKAMENFSKARESVVKADADAEKLETMQKHFESYWFRILP